MTKEIWKPIEGYEVSYMISNLGSIKSLARKYRSGANYLRIAYTRDIILKPSISRNGYKRTRLYKDGDGVSHNIHRLVAMTFIDNPDGKPTVNHKNGIKTDNRTVNLEWNTFSENQTHGYRMGLNKGPRGELCGHAKLTEKDVREIRRRYKEGGIFQRELGEEYGITRSSIGAIVRRKSWKHI